MKKDRKSSGRSEAGIALLIAIFVLLLISVVAIALLVSSGTETALGANYRSSSTVYYAALAGLEEARGRLLPKNPNYFGASVISPGTTFPLGQTIYLVNALPSETVAPWDSSNLYYDQEYQSEFGVAASSASWQSVNSVWNNDAQGIPGPVYKWARINAVTEKSLYMDVNQDGVYDSTTPIFYDPAHVDSHGNPMPSLIVTSSPPSTAVQALEITALAYLPNGSQKFLQYLVAPITMNITFPAALTLDGTNVGSNSTYPLSVPSYSGFFVNGNDQYSPNSCVPGANPVSGIGYTSNSGSDTSYSNITSAIPAWNHGNYKGWGAASPNVNYVGGPPAPSLAANLQTVAGLDDLVAAISQNADVTLNGPVIQSDSNNLMPAAMSATNPVTVVVNGDLTFNGWHATGYGILLVTGVFTYDPDATWDGIVLVIGKGIMYAHQLGTGQFNGAVLLASTVDASGNPLPISSPSLGSPSFSFTSSAQSQGIYYSSCWIQYVQSPLKYQVLSFHEIPQ
jgi:hypothetical protein